MMLDQAQRGNILAGKLPKRRWNYCRQKTNSKRAKGRQQKICSTLRLAPHHDNGNVSNASQTHYSTNPSVNTEAI